MLLTYIFGCAGLTITSPKSAEIPLFRTTEHGERLYVPVKLPDGDTHYFILDTGASVSVLSWEIANELGIEATPQRGVLVGVSGYSSWSSVEVPSISIGRTHLNDVTFAVGVEGLPKFAGAVPVAGLLGNNVLSNFVMDIDYSGNTLQLHNPDNFSLPDNALAMTYDGSSISAPITLNYTSEGKEQSEVLYSVKLDTGSRGLLLNQLHVPVFSSNAKGTIPNIHGIGNKSQMWNRQFIESTYKAEVDGIVLQDKLIKGPFEATIMATGPQNRAFVSLLGHDVFDGNRLIIDYKNQKFTFDKSTSERPYNDIHDHRLSMLDWGPKTDKSVEEMVNILYTKDKVPSAIDLLESYLRRNESSPLTIYLARLYRLNGQFDKSLARLSSLSDIEQLQENIWVENANLLQLLEQEPDTDALLSFSKEHEDSYEASIAISDVLYLQGKYKASHSFLSEAIQRTQDPNAFLFRKARIYSALGDQAGALSQLRRLIVLNPYGGQELWFYALMAKGTEFENLAHSDINFLREKLYIEDGSLDFFAAAYHILGDEETAKLYFNAGLSRDCETLDGHLKSNCEIWYSSMIGQVSSEQLEIMKSLIKDYPARSDFLDTYAVALGVSGDLDSARDASFQAALRDPSDIYMLWQIEAIPNYFSTER